MGSLQNDKFVKVLNCKSIPIAHCQNDHGGLPSHSKIKTMPIVVQVPKCTVLHEFETFNGYFCTVQSRFSDIEFSDNLWSSDYFTIVTVFAKTKSVTQSRLHFIPTSNIISPMNYIGFLNLLNQYKCFLLYLIYLDRTIELLVLFLSYLKKGFIKTASDQVPLSFIKEANVGRPSDS